TVEVVGTEFSVGRTDGKVEIQVSAGVVLVRGDVVPGHVQRLGAGEALTLTEASASMARSAPVPSHASDLPVAPSPDSEVAPRGSSSHRERKAMLPKSDQPHDTPPVPSPASEQPRPLAASWRELAQAHRYGDAWTAGRKSLADPAWGAS